MRFGNLDSHQFLEPVWLIGPRRRRGAKNDRLPIGREDWGIYNLWNPRTREGHPLGVTSVCVCYIKFISCGNRLDGNIHKPGGVGGDSRPECMISDFFSLTIRIAHSENIIGRIELSIKWIITVVVGIINVFSIRRPFGMNIMILRGWRWKKKPGWSSSIQGHAV